MAPGFIHLHLNNLAWCGGRYVAERRDGGVVASITSGGNQAVLSEEFSVTPHDVLGPGSEVMDATRRGTMRTHGGVQSDACQTRVDLRRNGVTNYLARPSVDDGSGVYETGAYPDVRDVGDSHLVRSRYTHGLQQVADRGRRLTLPG